MTTEDDTDKLVDQIAAGDQMALDTLLSKHRVRLNKMVRHRMDQRLIQRVDASDIVQDALSLAAKHFDQFLGNHGTPFYPWLRKIAVNRMIDLRRIHIEAERRSVHREVKDLGSLSSEGQAALSQRLVQLQESPSEQLITEEQRERVRNTLLELREVDREVLAMRFLEQLSTAEAAAALNISENAFAQRLVRSLRRVKKLLDTESRKKD